MQHMMFKPLTACHGCALGTCYAKEGQGVCINQHVTFTQCLNHSQAAEYLIFYRSVFLRYCFCLKSNFTIKTLCNNLISTFSGRTSTYIYTRVGGNVRVEVLVCIHLVNVDVRQVRPEGYVHPDDIFYEESSRAAAGRRQSPQGADRDTVSLLIWTEWPM